MRRGGQIMGFSEKKWARVQKIQSGDRLLCYMIKRKCFFAILEVTGKAFMSTDPIWDDAVYPARLNVKVTLELNPGQAVPVVEMMGKLSYLAHETSKSWGVHFRGLPKLEREVDAETIEYALKNAKESRCCPPEPVTKHSHDEIQWLLLSLGSRLGLKVRPANNDFNKSYEGNSFSKVKGLRKTLPVQFDQRTQTIIEHIDVLWLQGSSIVAAFEIEHSTSIYSGLLRMSDLIARQPNLNINLYIVAPDKRRQKVKSEINRPTFSSFNLPRVCKYIAYSKLQNLFESQGNYLHYAKPEILDTVVEDMSN